MPLSTTFASTCFMSQGARNCPFLTLTVAPGLCRGNEKVGLPREEGRDLQDVHDLCHFRALPRLVHVRQHRQAELAAKVGEDGERRRRARRRAFPRGWCGSPCRSSSCRRARCRAFRISPSAPRRCRRHARGSPSGTAPRSRRAAANCRNGRSQPERRRSAQPFSTLLKATTAFKPGAGGTTTCSAWRFAARPA